MGSSLLLPIRFWIGCREDAWRTMTAGTPVVEGPGSRKGSAPGLRLWHRFVRWDLASVSIALMLICGALLAVVPAFRSAYNLRALGFTIAVTGVVALAQVCVLSVGQFNLALTAIGAMVG
jgi:hypothetical protein